MILVTLVALTGALLGREQQRRHHDIDDRLSQQAQTGAAMIAALRESTVASVGLQYARRLDAGLVSRARLDALAEHRGARYADVLAADGRVLAASSRSPYVVGRRVTDQNFHLGRDTVTVSAPLGRRTLAIALPRQGMTNLLTTALARLPSVWPADMYAVDGAGRLVSAWGPHAATPGGAEFDAAEIDAASRSPLRRGTVAMSTAPIAGTTWNFVLRVPRAESDAAISGSALLLPWVLLVALSLAGAFVFLLVVRARRVTAALRVEKERATAVLTVLSDGYLLVRGGRVVDVNDRLCALTGLDREALLGASEHHPLVAAITAIGQCCGLEGREGHGIVAHADGHAVEVAVTTQATDESAGLRPGRVSVVRDIASQKRTERRLSRLARTDALTGLANRGAFDSALPRYVEQARREGLPLSLVILDVDHFKAVNDRHGHPVGDGVLAEVGQRISGAVREGDLVARIGGEEFAWMMPGLGPEAARRAAERARGAVGGEAFAVAGSLTVSAGIATLGDDTPLELYAAADGALLRAKRGGRDRAVGAEVVQLEPALAV